MYAQQQIVGRREEDVPRSHCPLAGKRNSVSQRWMFNNTSNNWASHI